MNPEPTLISQIIDFCIFAGVMAVIVLVYCLLSKYLPDVNDTTPPIPGIDYNPKRR